VPRLSRLGPASNALSRTPLPARPDHLAGYSPEITSHTPLIDFCSCQESWTQPRSPKLVPRARRPKPPRWTMAPLLRVAANRASQLRGCASPKGLATPRTDVRTPTRIYPNLIDPNTSCRASMTTSAWNCRAPATDRADRPGLSSPSFFSSPVLPF
jgi:hypothetical protein